MSNTPPDNVSETDWKAIDSPEVTEAAFARARPAREVFPDIIEQTQDRDSPKSSKKQQITLRLDPDIVHYFKAQGQGWQTRINIALRKAIEK